MTSLFSFTIACDRTHPLTSIFIPKLVKQNTHLISTPSMASTSISHVSRTPNFRISTSPRHINVFSCLSLNQTDQNPNPTTPTNPSHDLRIVFAAGGTGGHIYPAVAIADQLKSINPTIQILFVGIKDGMESTAIPSAGYTFLPIPAYPLARPLISPKNLLFPYLLLKSILETSKILNSFNPQIVVGTGGYVSAPICLAAALKRIKLVIQEQNSIPGIANWLLSRFADLVFLTFPSSLKYFPKNKCVVSGNPIRLSLRRYVSKAVARLHFFPRAAKNWDSESKVLLVLGGSLGANAINITLLNMYYQLLMEHKNLFIIWQTGVDAFIEMESLVKHHPRLVLEPFLHTMDLAYAAADLVVSRAGAMTCSEILATGKPSILIPSPNVAEGHQMKNAYVMSDLAGSQVIIEEELDSTTLRIAIEELLEDECLMAEMCEKATKAARPEAAAEIAEGIFSLVNLSVAKGE